MFQVPGAVADVLLICVHVLNFIDFINIPVDLIIRFPRYTNVLIKITIGTVINYKYYQLR